MKIGEPWCVMGRDIRGRMCDHMCDLGFDKGDREIEEGEPCGVRLRG